MAQGSKLKKEDISESDLFKHIGDSAAQTLTKVELLNNSLKEVVESLKVVYKNSDTKSSKGIDNLLFTQKELNKAVKEGIDLEKKKLAGENVKARNDLKAQIADQKAKIILDRESIKNSESQAKRDIANERLGREKIKTNESLLRGQERLNKQAAKEADIAAKNANAYTKTERQLRLVTTAYNNLAAKKERYGKLNEYEEMRLNTLSKVTLKYNDTLKAIDATTGKHGRNVGNYKSAFDGLGMSISQLAREAPAFANSMQTGFMAISNNLPMFFDEIKKINEQNKILKSEGQATTSAFSQIGKSLLSFTTLLSVGVTLLTFFGGAMIDWATSLFTANKAIDQQANLLKYRNEENKRSSKFIAEESAQFAGNILALKATNAGSKERTELIGKINKQYGTTIQNLKDEKKFQAELNNELANYLEYAKAKYRTQKLEEVITNNLDLQGRLTFRIANERRELNKLLKQGALDQKTVYETDDLGVRTGQNLVLVNEELAKKHKEVSESLAQNIKDLADSKIRFENYGNVILDAQTNLDRLTNHGKKYTNQNDKNKQSTDKHNESLRITNVYLNEQNTLLAQNIQLLFDRSITESQTATSAYFDNLLKSVRETGQLNVDELERMIDETNSILQTQREKRLQDDIDSIKESYNKQTTDELAALEEKKAAIIDKQGSLTKEQEAEYQNELDLIEENRIEREKDQNLKIENLKRESAKEEINIEKQKNEEINTKNDELNDALEDYYKQKNEKQQKDLETQKKLEKERRDMIELYGEEIINGFIDRSKKRESILKKEEDASRKQEDYLRQLAVNGNADAKDSLAAQQNVTTQKQLLAEKEAKKQQQLEELKLVYKAIMQYVDKGDSLPQATIKGLAGTIGIRKLIAAIPQFFKGTKTTVADELGTPHLNTGKDDYLVRVDGSEMVFNPKQSAAVGGATTDEVVNGFLLARNLQNSISLQKSVSNNYLDVELLAREMREIKEVIKSKPEMQLSEGIRMGIARSLIVTEREGLTRKRTTYES